MLNMTQINFIRDLAKSGYNISKIHEMTNADPKTIKKYLEKNDFSPTPPIKQARNSIVAPFRDRIMEYLEEDSSIGYMRNQRMEQCNSQMFLE